MTPATTLQPPHNHLHSSTLIRLINYKNKIYKIIVITNDDRKKIYVTPLLTYNPSFYEKNRIETQFQSATSQPTPPNIKPSSPSSSPLSSIGKKSGINFVSGSTGNKQRVTSETSKSTMSYNKINQINKIPVNNYKNVTIVEARIDQHDVTSHFDGRDKERRGGGSTNIGAINASNRITVDDDDDDNYNPVVYYRGAWKNNKTEHKRNRINENNLNPEIRNKENEHFKKIKVQASNDSINNDNRKNVNKNDYGNGVSVSGAGEPKENFKDQEKRLGPPTGNNLHLLLSYAKVENYSNDMTENKDKRRRDIPSKLKYRNTTKTTNNKSITRDDDNFKSSSHYLDTKFIYPSLPFNAHPQNDDDIGYNPELSYSNIPHKLQSIRVHEDFERVPNPYVQYIFRNRHHQPIHGYSIYDRHPPPDPHIQILLSHYGKYLPGSHYWSGGYGFYSYSAGNDYHNNLPIGEYKRTSEHD